MKPTRLLTALLCVTTPLACARGNSASGDLEHAEAATTEVPYAAALVGDWHLASDPPMPMPRLQMRFTVDSVDGPTYFGRLSHYFSGNVGGDLAAFKPFVGSMADDDSVEFRVDQRDPAMLGIVVAGRLIADTIRATTLIVGPDTLSRGTNRSWFLVKR